MLTHESLKKDVAQRILRVQKMMQEKDLGALIVVGAGGPGTLGGIRYLTNAQLWSGRAYVVLGNEDPDPWIEIWSRYQAVWTRRETTTMSSRVERPDDLVGRTARLAMDYARETKRIGMVNTDRLLSVGEHRQFVEALGSFQMVDVTSSFDRIRQIKTPFEIEAIQQNGAILDASMNVFREHAGVGERYWDACAATEAFVKSQGAFWGRTKLSLDVTPYTVPPPRDQVMKEDDIINFEIVYDSRWGYFHEMTTVFSFHELPDDVHALLKAYLKAVDNSSSVVRPGNTLQAISEANDQTFVDLGFSVAGKHTPDCHCIGLDENDGPGSIAAPDFVLEANMVLSFHPGTVLKGGRGFLVSDNFLVTPLGAERLSTHNLNRYHLLLHK
jgi:Xaa-Pro aminopeptidase